MRQDIVTRHHAREEARRKLVESYIANGSMSNTARLWGTSVSEATGAGIQFTGRVCGVPTSGVGHFQCYLDSRGW